jgi:hypothetical protein
VSSFSEPAGLPARSGSPLGRATELKSLSMDESALPRQRQPAPVWTDGNGTDDGAHNRGAAAAERPGPPGSPAGPPLREQQPHGAPAALLPKDMAAAAQEAFQLTASQQVRGKAAAAVRWAASAVTSTRLVEGAAVVLPQLKAKPGPAQISGREMPERRVEGATVAVREAVKEALSHQDGSEMLIHFSVRDTGIGIRKDDLHRLFHSFSQVTHGGLAQWPV